MGTLPLDIEPRKIKGLVLDVDGTMYDAFPIRIIMAVYLLVTYGWNPRLFLRVVKIISSYRHAQESLRERSKISYSPPFQNSLPGGRDRRLRSAFEKISNENILLRKLF